MKKIVLGFLILLAGVPAGAANSPQVVGFLHQLNLRYYCLNREGLQDFSCTMKLTLPPSFAWRFKEELRRNNIFQGDQIVDALNQVEYLLTVSGGKTKVLVSEPPSTGNDQTDGIIQREASLFGNLCQQVIEVWAGATVTPAVSEEELAKDSFQVKNGTGGFTIQVLDADGSQGTEVFDPQANLQAILATAKDTSVSIHTGYAPTPKGYLLQSWDMAAGDFNSHSSITYGVVDRYWLPQKWTFHMLVPGALSDEDEFTIDFAHYQINQEGKDKSFVHFISVIAPPAYHFDSGVSQIEATNKTFVPSRNVHELGLTEFDYKWGTDFNYEAKGDPEGGELRIWVTKVYAVFAAPKFDVYVASKYPQGSCAYQAILDHENTHVAIDQRTFAKYQVLIKKALEADRDLPTPGHPWVVKNIKAGKAMVKHHLDGIVGPLVKKFWAEMGLANGRIDLPDSYARVHAKCQDW